MTVDAGPSALLERDAALAEAARVLGLAASGLGSVLLIEGRPGIGKTALGRAVHDLAADHGCQTLSARGEELEREYQFGLVRQLCSPLLKSASASERKGLFDGPARLAAHVFALDHVGGLAARTSGELGPLVHGLYWLVANLTERGPVLLLVDDLQWADDASLAFVHYLVRRIEQLPMLLVITARRPDSGPEPEVLGRIAADLVCTVVRPEPLSLAAVSQLIEAVAAEPEEAFCASFHHATGGNPLLVRELLHETVARGMPPRASEIHELERVAPTAVSRSVLLRLARLPEPCRRLARALAVLGGAVALRHAAALGDLVQADAAAAADDLAAAGILVAGRPLDFVHPLLRQAVYVDVPVGERGILHDQAARVLEQEAAPASRVASHLLSSEPASDAWVVHVLRRAAAEAMADGVPRSAVTFLRRALAEPPDPRVRIDVLIEIGRACSRAGLAGDSRDALREALRFDVTPQRRVDTAIELAELSGTMNDPEGAIAVLDEFTAGVSEAELVARVANARLRFIARAPMRAEPPPPFAQVIGLADHRPADPVVLQSLSILAVWHGESREVGAGLALRAMQAWGDGFPGQAVETLVYTDHFEPAAELLERYIAEGRRVGSPFLQGAAFTWRGQLRYRLGQLTDAEADCRIGYTIAEELDFPLALTCPAAFLCDVLVERGELDAAEAVLAPVVPWPSGHSPWFLDSRARLLVSQGRLAEAREDLSALLARRDRFRSPGHIAWRSTLALVLHRGGESREARQLASEEVELARKQGSPRALGSALRVLGMVTDGPTALTHLEAATHVLGASPAELERARALAELGAAQRRDGQPKQARGPLRQALDLAHRCGATVLAEAITTELALAGARPRRIALTGVDALTPGERRVAQLAAEGLSNRAIAAQLFVAIRTVTTHLTTTYQKLGIEGRHELPAALAPDPSPSSSRYHRL